MTFDPSGALSPWHREPVRPVANAIAIALVVVGQGVLLAGMLIGIGGAPWGWLLLLPGFVVGFVGMWRSRMWQRLMGKRMAERQPLARPLQVSGYATTTLATGPVVQMVQRWMTDNGVAVLTATERVVTGRRVLSNRVKNLMILGPVGQEGLEYDAVATLSAGRVEVTVTTREQGVLRFIVDDREVFRHVASLVDDLEHRLRAGEGAGVGGRA